jgi:hypothetical protein
MTPGRGGTCLKLDVEVVRRFGKITARLAADPELDGEDAEAALDKLATWLERSAIAIRHRGAPTPLVCEYRNPIDPDES